MRRAMDGVRTSRRPEVVRPIGVVRAPAESAPRPVPAPPPGIKYVVGMDGMRRAVRVTEPVRRPRTRAMQPNAVPTPAPIPQAFAPTSPMAPALEPAQTTPVALASEPRVPRRPSLPFHFPALTQSRYAMMAGVFVLALTASGIAVRVLASPQNTAARASEGQPVRASAAAPTSSAPIPSATPTPAAQVAVSRPSAQLQQLLAAFTTANPGTYEIVVKNLTTGEYASLNADTQMTSASLYKLYVAQRTFARIDIGQTSYAKPAGGDTGRTIGDCLRVMINVSDNACGRALGKQLGWGAQDQALEAEGYTHTTLAQPQKTSAADVAHLLERLYRGTLLSADSTNRFMGLLKDQRVNNRLPVGLPAGTVIAHKTGDLDGVVHDAGIVYGPKSNYLVVVMSGPWPLPANAAPKFADLSSQLWNYFEK